MFQWLLKIFLIPQFNTFAKTSLLKCKRNIKLEEACAEYLAYLLGMLFII